MHPTPTLRCPECGRAMRVVAITSEPLAQRTRASVLGQRMSVSMTRLNRKIATSSGRRTMKVRAERRRRANQSLRSPRTRSPRRARPTFHCETQLQLIARTAPPPQPACRHPDNEQPPEALPKSASPHQPGFLNRGLEHRLVPRDVKALLVCHLREEDNNRVIPNDESALVVSWRGNEGFLRHGLTCK